MNYSKMVKLFIFLLIILLVGCGSNVNSVSPNSSKTLENTEQPGVSSSTSSQTQSSLKKENEEIPTPNPEVSENSKDNSIDHIIVVIEENHSYRQIVGNKDAPYMNELIKKGAFFTNSHGLTHPSQPNYVALFSGSTQGISDDSCGKMFSSPNLASELIQQKLSFIGYSEDLPKVGFTGCSSNGYARKHNPWVQFNNVPSQFNQPFSTFPQEFSKLPTLSFVIPNHQDDMHDGTVQQADSWLKNHLATYVSWAETHHSLLLITWDEDDNSKDNHIPTIFVGPMVKQGNYDKLINHYNVLRSIEEIFHLPLLGESAKAESITEIWKK